jgi:hypothetical protein
VRSALCSRDRYCLIHRSPWRFPLQQCAAIRSAAHTVARFCTRERLSACAGRVTLPREIVPPNSPSCSLCVQLGVRPQVHVLRHAGVHGARDPHGRGARQGGRLVVRATLSTQSAHCAHRQARWCKHVWTRAHAHAHPRTLFSWLAHANALLVMDGATTGADQVAWDSYLRDACRPTAVLFAQQEGNVQQTKLLHKAKPPPLPVSERKPRL